MRYINWIFQRIFKRNLEGNKIAESDNTLLEGKKPGTADLENIVFYIDNGSGSFSPNFKLNYEKIQSLFKEKNLIFFYFPAFKADTNYLHSLIKPFVDYNYPYFKEQESDTLTENYYSLVNEIEDKAFYASLAQILSLPFSQKAVLYRNVYSNRFSSFELTGDTDLLEQIEYYLSKVRFYSDACYYQLADKSTFDDSEDRFKISGQIISDEILEKVELLRLNGQYGTLLTIIRNIAEKLISDGIPYEKLTNSINDKLNSESRLSRLIIDRHYRIILPDFDNMEIKLSPLAKAVYILFLSHPEGIMLKNLAEYKQELTNIYNKISNRSDQDKISESIDALLNTTDNSINEKCSRIKEAFIGSMDDSIASNYYITGARGEPKKIPLPNHLIQL